VNAGSCSKHEISYQLGETAKNRVYGFLLSHAVGKSEPHFYRKFKQATGSTPIDWLRRERINHARRRLLESGDPIKQISEQVGYNDPFFFSRDFKRYTGVAPKDYRSQHIREI
jgi:AraC family transcriptional regulator of arabinose operon